MTTRLFLVRHGATTLSAEDRFAGSTDIPLSDEGRRQAASLAARLRDDTLAAVYCSPMRRTIETASILADPHGVAAVTRPGLREIDHGHWEGLRRQEVESQFHDEYTRWAKSNGYEVVYCADSIAIHSHNYTPQHAYKRAFGDAKALAAPRPVAS